MTTGHWGEPATPYRIYDAKRHQDSPEAAGMGSYAQLTIGGYPVYSSKNYYDRWFFRKKDRAIRTRTKAERNPLVWVAAAPHEQDEAEVEYAYAVSGSVLRRRLALAGFNRERLEQEFKQCMSERIQRLEELSAYGGDWVPTFSRRIPPLRQNNQLDSWLRALKYIVDQGIHPSQWNDEVEDAHSDPVVALLLETDEWSDDLPPGHETGFPCQSLESAVVAFLEALPADVECTLDVTELVEGGWTDSFDDLVEHELDHTTFYRVFAAAIADTRSLMLLSPENKTLARLLYANAITGMETYLSDTLKKQVLTRPAIRRRFVENSDAFREKIPVQDIYRRLAGLPHDIAQAIDMMSFHNLDKTTGVYKSVLDAHFSEMHLPSLRRAVGIRHDIVHRNGKTPQGDPVNVAMADVSALIELVDAAVQHIDKQIKDGLLDEGEDEEEEKDDGT